MSFVLVGTTVNKLIAHPRCELEIVLAGADGLGPDVRVGVNKFYKPRPSATVTPGAVACNAHVDFLDAAGALGEQVFLCNLFGGQLTPAILTFNNRAWRGPRGRGWRLDGPLYSGFTGRTVGCNVGIHGQVYPRPTDIRKHVYDGVDSGGGKQYHGCPPARKWTRFYC